MIDDDAVQEDADKIAIRYNYDCDYMEGIDLEEYNEPTEALNLLYQALKNVGVPLVFYGRSTLFFACFNLEAANLSAFCFASMHVSAFCFASTHFPLVNRRSIGASFFHDSSRAIPNRP